MSERASNEPRNQTAKDNPSFFRLLTAPCSEMTELVSRELDTPLTRAQRVALRLHLLYCRACSRYRRQVIELKARLAAESDTLEVAVPGLAPEARARIERALHGAEPEKPE